MGTSLSLNYDLPILKYSYNAGHYIMYIVYLTFVKNYPDHELTFRPISTLKHSYYFPSVMHS